MQNIKTYTSHQETQTLVSFVIAYYDLPVQMLGKCIGSILALALHPGEREIIVIDDGSNVSPMNILMQYGEEIIYVRQKNAGLSNARNKGIEMATGQYIQFVDADDWLVAEPYNHCLNLLKQSPDTDMVIFDFTTTDKQQSSYKDTTYPSGTDRLSVPEKNSKRAAFHLRHLPRRRGVYATIAHSLREHHCHHGSGLLL